MEQIKLYAVIQNTWDGRVFHSVHLDKAAAEAVAVKYINVMVIKFYAGEVLDELEAKPTTAQIAKAEQRRNAELGIASIRDAKNDLINASIGARLSA